MRSLPDKKIIGALVTLSIAQVIGWGTISLPAIIGTQIAADLHLDLPTVFAGTSTFYIAMGLCVPWLARPFALFGARRMMVAGTMMAAPGFLIALILGSRNNKEAEEPDRTSVSVASSRRLAEVLRTRSRHNDRALEPRRRRGP
jgi:MFS family permease